MKRNVWNSRGRSVIMTVPRQRPQSVNNLLFLSLRNKMLSYRRETALQRAL